MSHTEVEPIHVGALTMRFLVTEDDSDGAMTVFEVDVPAGARVPAPHSHDAFTETIYGLAGTVRFTVGGEDHLVGPGESVCIRPGVVHGFESTGEDDCRFLAMVSPGVFGPAYFREIGAVLAASAGGPPDQAAIGDVMRRHGLTPA